jgi:hypothetical protein
MKYNYTKIFTLALCILFAFSAISFADTFEEKVRAKAEDGDAYVKSNHNYTPRFIDKAGLALEDFESGIFPPTGWTEYHTGVDGLDISAVQAYSPDSSALFNDVSGVDTSWFITPQILALDAGAQLSFYQYQNWYTYYVYHGIWISTASGDPTVGDFIELDSLGVGIEDTWEFVTVDLSAYAGQDVYIAFVYAGDFADEWFLDDIAVAPPAAYDIGVASVYTETTDLLIPGANVTVNAIIQNFGASDATGFDVDLSVDDGHTETFLYSGNLAVGTTDTVTFTNPWVPATGGSFVLTSFTEWGDANPSNDTSSVTMDIIGVESLDFEEHFEDYTTVPNSIGWLGDPNTNFGAFVPNTTDDGLWRNRDFGNDPTLTNSARVNLYGTSSDDGGWLISPPIDMTTGGPNNMLSFDASITPWTGTDSTGLNSEDSIYIVISTDGLNWDRSNIIASFDSTSVVMPGGTHYDIDISAWDNETALHIGLLAIDNAGPNDKLFFIDNIFVGPPPVPAPIFEDFETGITGTPGTMPAGWTNEGGDDFDWYVDAGGTGSAGTGPAVDHTLGTAAGIYIYTEASGANAPNKLALVTSPFIDVSGLASPALSFWYHMAGGAMGDLHVDVYDGATWHLDVGDVLSGPQQGDPTDPWLMKTADLSGYGDRIKVRFRGITGGGWASDMAVDDVTIDDASTIPYDVIAQGIELPVLSMIPLTQPSITSSLELAASFVNQAADNTGDVTVEIYDTTGTIVFTDGDLGVTIPGFSSQSFSYVTDASDADSGMTYTAAIFATNFTDTVASNDTSWAYPVVFGSQMGYDQGNWDVNLAWTSPGGRTRFATRFDLLDDDILTDVTLGLGSGTATDSFSIDVYTSDADTPSVMLHRIFRGTIADAGGPSAVVSFVAPDIPLPAGDYWIVFDLDVVTNYPIGADANAIGSANVPMHFAINYDAGWTWLENTSFGGYTPILRIGLAGAPPIPDPSIIYADDFEAYTSGTQLTVQNNTDWTTWSGTPGTAEDPFVSSTYANSGVNSVNIITNNDCVKPMPNYTTGAYKISFDMYIPTGTVAYFNTLQEFTPTPQWGMQVQFNAGGNGDIDGGGLAAATFTYAYDTWLHNEVWVNLEKDTAEYYIDGVRIHGWKWTDGTFGTTVGPLQLGGNNFFGGGPVGTFDFYIDDYELKEVPSALFEETFDTYTAGTQLTVQNSVDWTTWSGTPGTGEDPFVSDAYANSGANSVVIVQNNDLVRLHGSLTSGVYSMSFMAYVPSGQSGYFNTLAGFTPNAFNWGMDCYFDVGGGGRMTGGSATEVTFSYAHDTWFLVETVVDLDQDLAEFRIDGAVIHQWQWTLGSVGSGSPLQLDANDFFGAAASDEMYMDDYVFDTTAPLTPNSIGDGTNALPTIFDLAQNYPNPFNPTTTIKYQLPKKADVKIVIYNMLGQLVRTVVDKAVDAGYQEVVWDGLNDTGSRVATGIYIYRMEAGDFVKSHKMIMMK